MKDYERGILADITFLFGSGADSDFNENLKSGNSFAELLIKNKYSEQIKSITENAIDKDIQLIHHSSTKVFLKTVETHSDLMREKDFFDNKDIDTCLSYIRKSQHKEKNNTSYDKIRKICKKWYDELNKDSEIKSFFLKNAVFFDTLDEKFNTLRNIDYTTDECRIVAAYLHVFINIFIARYEVSEQDFEWSYGNIFKTIQENKNPDIMFDNEKSYYCSLKKSGIPCNIVTTNYTDLCERITGKDVTYLHGKLSWFEDLKHLTVYDCTNAEENNLALYNKKTLIPFILIPSGVKPLICRKQIEQFHNLIQMLDKSKFLIVNGYAFNSEDNHINSIIGDWLRKCDRHKLIYFDYKDEGNDSNSNNEEMIFSKTNWAKNISQNVFSNTSDIDSIFSAKSQIISIKVYQENCRDVFNNFIEAYKKINRLEEQQK